MTHRIFLLGRSAAPVRGGSRCRADRVWHDGTHDVGRLHLPRCAGVHVVRQLGDPGNRG